LSPSIDRIRLLGQILLVVQQHENTVQGSASARDARPIILNIKL